MVDGWTGWARGKVGVWCVYVQARRVGTADEQVEESRKTEIKISRA